MLQPSAANAAGVIPLVAVVEAVRQQEVDDFVFRQAIFDYNLGASGVEGEQPAVEPIE